MIGKGDNKVLIYRGDTPLNSVWWGDNKIYPNDLPTEPVIEINPGGQSATLYTGVYRDMSGKEFVVDTPRTLYLNPDVVTPGSGVINLPTEYTQYNAPTNRKFIIWNDYEAHTVYNYGGGAGFINCGTHHCVNEGEKAQTLAMIQVSVSTKEVDKYGWVEATDSVTFTPSAAARGKIIDVGLTASPRFNLYPNGSEIEADISLIYTANGVETVVDTASHTYTGGGYTTYPSMSVRGTLGLTDTASFKVSVHAKAKKGSAGIQGLYGLFATTFTSAFVPGYVDGCYSVKAYYDEYSDIIYIMQAEVAEGTKFGIACIQTGQMISWHQDDPIDTGG